MELQEASELEFLQWYFGNHDFGPAHEDVVCILMNQFEEETGKSVPAEYAEGYM